MAGTGRWCTIASQPRLPGLLAAKGTTFDDAVDSFALCCPERATFITAQYAHNHGVKDNFAPYGWGGVTVFGSRASHFKSVSRD